MSRPFGKGRVSGGGAGFGSPARSGLRIFSTTSRSANLSYLSEPPDFSSISDANVVVSFKNLLKKDGTTKSKALEDLVAYVEAHPYDQDGGAEEAILEAWVRLFCGCRKSLRQVVIYATGSDISAYFDRQLSPGSRALPHSATLPHEVCAQTNGEAHPQGSRPLACRHL
jgi:hypothetical protein